jgi:uroporphyrinogen decarboxylase
MIENMLNSPCERSGKETRTFGKEYRVINSLERFMSACRGDAVDRPPVWIMRQAGRTLPEYLKLRQTHSFWDLCMNPELAAEVTLQPIRRFPLDAAVVFSDILVIPQVMGMDVQFTPRLTVTPPIRTPADLNQLTDPHISSQLKYVPDTIQLVKKTLDGSKAVLGFSGAPFTLACYMVEGGGSKAFFNQTRGFMHGQPEAFKTLLKLLSTVVADYLELQCEAGANAVQLFDTWASILSLEDFQRFALPSIRSIVERIQKKKVPIIYYVNGIGNVITAAAETGADVLGIDWRTSLSTVRKTIGKSVPVQGNLDPATLLSDPIVIRKRVHAMLNQTGGKGHIANLGHGILPQTPISNISAFISAVHEWTPGS